MECSVFELPAKEKGDRDQIVMHYKFKDEDIKASLKYDPTLDTKDKPQSQETSSDTEFNFEAETSDLNVLRFKASPNMALMKIQKHELYQDLRDKDVEKSPILDGKAFQRFTQNENVPRIFESGK